MGVSRNKVAKTMRESYDRAIKAYLTGSNTLPEDNRPHLKEDQYYI